MPAIEQRLRSRVRRAIRASPDLLAEYRLQRAARRPPLWMILLALCLAPGAPMMLVGLPLAALAGFEVGGGIHRVLGAVGLGGACLACWFAERLRRTLCASPTLSVLC